MHRFLALSVLLLGACSSDAARFRPLAVGDDAPAFAALALSGDTVRLAAFEGHTLLLNIWATWCAPCREEMPGLQALHERYHERGLRVVGVSVDAPGSDEPIRRFVSEFGIGFLILFDPADDVSRAFRTSGVPETFLIDARGRIAHRWIGRFDPLAPEAVARVERLLGS